MVQYFQHPAFEANRRSPRMHKAFAQLWGTADLWATLDRVGFNAPVRPGFRFRGPHLHWDISLMTPMPFGTQGMIYLTDTTPSKARSRVCPASSARRLAEGLAAGCNPRQHDLHARLAPIAGRAGDLIIWHLALPHGACPNRRRGPGWRNTSICLRRTSKNRKSGFSRRPLARRLQRQMLEQCRPAGLRTFDGE